MTTLRELAGDAFGKEVEEFVPNILVVAPPVDLLKYETQESTRAHRVTDLFDLLHDAHNTNVVGFQIHGAKKIIRQAVESRTGLGLGIEEIPLSQLLAITASMCAYRLKVPIPSYTLSSVRVLTGFNEAQLTRDKWERFLYMH